MGATEENQRANEFIRLEPIMDGKVRSALQAIVDFHDGPWEAKRPDSFEILIQRARTALAEPQPSAQDIADALADAKTLE